MLWFSNVRASPPQFIGVRLTEKRGAPVLILLYPDGSQETEIFDHEDALVEGGGEAAQRAPHERLAALPRTGSTRDGTRSLTSYRSRFLPFYPDLTRMLADARWCLRLPLEL